MFNPILLSGLYGTGGLSPEEQEEMMRLQQIQQNPPSGPQTMRPGMQPPPQQADLAGNPYGGGALDPRVSSAYEHQSNMARALDQGIANQPFVPREESPMKNIMREGLPALIGAVATLGGAGIPMALAYAMGAGSLKTEENKQYNRDEPLNRLQSRYNLAAEQTKTASDALGVGKHSALPAEYRAFELMTQGMSPEEKEKARQIALGLQGRASNAGMSWGTVQGMDGRKRAVVFDPRSGQFMSPRLDGNGFEPVQAQPGSFVPSGDTPSVQSQPQGAPQPQQPPQGTGQPQIAPPGPGIAPRGGDPFVSRTPEEDAAAVRQAEAGIPMPPAGYEQDGQGGFRPVQGGPAQDQFYQDEVTRATRRSFLKDKAAGVMRDLKRGWDNAHLSGTHRAIFADYGMDNEVGFIRRSATKAVAGDERQLIIDINSIKSNIGIDQLQKMRESNATGGALGQIPVKQQEYLNALLGALSPEMGEEKLRENIAFIYNLYMDEMVDAIYGKPEEWDLLIHRGLATPEEKAASLAEGQEARALKMDNPFDQFGNRADKGGSTDGLNLSPAARRFMEGN
jgi:hypothetical protein